MSMELSASIIICTRNRCHDLVQCLASIVTQIRQPEELIIVDSSDKTLLEKSIFTDLFQSHFFPKTTLHYVHTTPGLTHQRNQGIKKAQADIIYFFDDDVILSRDYLQKMQEVFTSCPQFAGGMGTITNLTNHVPWHYYWFRRLFLLPHERGSGRFTLSGMPTHPYGTHTFKTVEVVGGCCMAFRKQVLLRYHFDETFRGYCYLEDADIARRISFKMPLFFNPAARLEHNESTAARDKRIDVHAMFIYNYSYLFFKNFYPYNRLKLIAYVWSLCGLFFQGLLWRDSHQIRGFFKGLIQFYIKRSAL